MVSVHCVFSSLWVMLLYFLPVNFLLDISVDFYLLEIVYFSIFRIVLNLVLGHLNPRGDESVFL